MRDPSKPQEVGRWWLPGTRVGDSEAPPQRHPEFDMGYRTHNTNVYPERPDRAYVGYIDGGLVILDISDRTDPRMISRLDYHPPATGFTHTVLPLFSQEKLIVSDEAIQPGGRDWPKPVWVVDIHDETRPMIIGTLPSRPSPSSQPAAAASAPTTCTRTTPSRRRYAATPSSTAPTSTPACASTTSPTPGRRRDRLLHPARPGAFPHGAAQMNDVYVDENGLIYAIERFTGGLYILQPEF